jgi:hypothetical protein
MELEKNKIIIYLSGAAAAAAIGLYFLFFYPAVKEFNKKSRECKAVEAQLLETRNNLASLKELEVKKILITEKEIPLAIAELINYGKLIGIDYISITSQPIIDTGDPQYRVLYIDLDIESSYKEIIEFISMFGKFKNSLVTPGNFSIIPDDLKPEGLKVKMVINMFVSK